LVGRAWPEAEGGDFLAVDWEQLARDQKYFAEREAALAAFAPEIIVNARTPRDFMADALVARCPALARVGFERANDDASQEAFAAKYTTLLSEAAPPARALTQVLGLPAPSAV
jgi:hypothetical protein